MNDIALTGLLATAPSTAFGELREKPRFWFPLIALIVATVAVQLWYFSLVDVPWLADHLMSGNERMANLPADARDRFLKAMTRNTMMWSSLISVAIVLPVVCAVQALYYLLAGKIAGVQQSFKHWFAMTTWCAMPALLASLVSLVVLLTESSPLQMGPEQLQVLSLNELFFHRPMNAPGATLLGSLSLVAPLAWALTTICVHVWTQRSWTFSATFALLPSVVFYGGWALIAFR
jgi:hypothetical protein